MAQVTTRTGDEGYTDLLGRGRVPKYHPRPEAFGAVDEATSCLGLARAQIDDRRLKDSIFRIQHDLYILMAELATTPENYEKVDFKVKGAEVERLDREAEELKAEVEIGKRFVVPGETVAGATLDLARTIVRRAERLVARLYHQGDVLNPDALRYLNRLSDLLFVMARYEEAQHPRAEGSSAGT